MNLSKISIVFFATVCGPEETSRAGEKYKSRPDMTYLTDAYGFYFADEGDEAYEGGQAVKLVIEVDTGLPRSRLFSSR